MAEYSATNVITENMWAQCDSQGNQHLLLKEIIDHRRQDDEGASVRGHNNQGIRQNTKGWKLCIAWKDGMTSWEPLKQLKESNPVEVAQYAVAKGIDKEPAFSWWVPHTIKKKERIVVAVNKRYHKRTHKFGIRIPKTVEEALTIDKMNGNSCHKERNGRCPSGIQGVKPRRKDTTDIPADQMPYGI